MRAMLFDLHGTLAFVRNPISPEEVSEFMLEHDYEVFPQSLRAAFHFVSMVDCPKHGYNDWQAYLKQVLHRLDTEIDIKTLEELANFYGHRNTYTLFPDAAYAVKEAKSLGLKTAIVTTIARFMFQPAIQPIQQYFDTIMTGFEAGCEKSNPKMHRRTLQVLNAKPQEAVMIGDELLVDMKIPKKLGLYTILLDRDNKIRSKPSNADVKAKTLREAIAMIEKWLRT